MKYFLKPHSIILLLIILFLVTLIACLALPVNASDKTLAHMIDRLGGDSEALETHFIDAAIRYDLPPRLLVAIGFYESNFRVGIKGDQGRSWGLMQVGKLGRRKCKCDMTTARGEIFCGACWLDKGRSWCGNLEKGLTAYACGKCVGNLKTKRKVLKRFKLAKIKLKSRRQ